MTAGEFAEAWLAAWNSHDLDRILAHYAEEVVFRSPKVLRFTGGRTDTLEGKDALRAYFAAGLAFRPALRFSAPKLCRDAEGVALIYRGEDGATAVETMTLSNENRISEARVFYDSGL